MSNLSEERAVDEDAVKEMAKTLRAQIESKLNMKLTFFKPIKYRQVNSLYFIKLKIAGVDLSRPYPTEMPITAGNNQPIKFIHIRVSQDDQKPILYDLIQRDKIESDPIEYFE